MEKIEFECHDSGQWVRIAEITATGNISKGIKCKVILEYDLDWASKYAGNHTNKALSVLYEVDFIQKNLPKWPSFLLDFLPQGAALKFIERHYGINITEGNN